MKKIFEYAGLIALVLFSFYYTNKVVQMNNEKDPIMISIKEYASKVNSDCKEGYITADGVVLGINGSIVNPILSYSNMKGVGFSEELMVFEEKECIVTKKSNIDYYIIKGNPNKKSVSILIRVKSLKYLKDVINISENKRVKLGIIVSGNLLLENKKYLSSLLNNNYDILYSGSNKEDLKKFINTIKSIDAKYKPFCIYIENNDILELCSKNELNTIKSEFYFNKDILKNVKNTLDKGNIIILEENKNVLDELSVIINFIKIKGLKVIGITEHLD